MAFHPAPRVACFGLFELDLQTGELRKQGVKLALQDQPFRVLAMLLARPGELVTREELRAALWPDAVFVDFDHGLNKAVGKIRQTLSDLADSPRFVETLPRRGYRFIGIHQGPLMKMGDGYWAPQVGFYGGISYGYGYFGEGYEGGRWQNGQFFYNRSVNNVNITVIHNVYNTTINNTTVNRVSYNGGNGGIDRRPTPQEEAVAH